MRRGLGVGPILLHVVDRVLYNGLGRYQDALAAADRASEDTHELVFSIWAAVELIEAASRSGVPEQGVAPSSASLRAPVPAAETGRSASRLVRERYSARAER